MEACARCVGFVMIGVTASILLGLPPVYAQDRMPPLELDDLTAEQRAMVEKFEAERGITTLRGPWVPLLSTPEVLGLMLDMRSHIRDRNVLGQKLAEFAILLTAREWTQQYERSSWRR